MTNHVLDLNTAKRPTLTLTLEDEAHTAVRIKTPTEGLISWLRDAVQNDLPQVRANDPDSVATLYTLAAKLISNNRDFLTVTPDELRGRYGMDLESLVCFYSAYLDFLNDVHNQKN